jgi:stage V sporulation protein SpoVS
MPNKKELRVAAHTLCNSLAGSIVASHAEGSEVTLSAVGPVPVRTACMAIAIANRTLASRGEVLVPIIAITERNLPDHDRPGMMIPWVVMTFRLISAFERVVSDDRAKDILTIYKESADGNQAAKREG